jgi:hypothetical protein
LERANDRVTNKTNNRPARGLCEGDAHCVFYAQDADRFGFTIRGDAKKVIAVNAKLPYEEIDMGTMDAGTHEFTNAERSDWAIAAGEERPTVPICMDRIHIDRDGPSTHNDDLRIGLDRMLQSSLISRSRENQNAVNLPRTQSLQLARLLLRPIVGTGEKKGVPGVIELALDPMHDVCVKRVLDVGNQHPNRLRSFALQTARHLVDRVVQFLNDGQDTSRLIFTDAGGLVDD